MMAWDGGRSFNLGEFRLLILFKQNLIYGLGNQVLYNTKRSKMWSASQINTQCCICELEKVAEVERT